MSVNFGARILNYHILGLLFSRMENIMVKNETTVTQNMSDKVKARVKVVIGNTSIPQTRGAECTSLYRTFFYGTPMT